VRGNKEPIPANPDAKQPNADNPYDTPMWRAIKRGLAGGALVGFVVAKYYMDSHAVETPIGTVYGGNVLLLFGVLVGLCAAGGAGIGWFATRQR
jgi:hypothetical protein